LTSAHQGQIGAGADSYLLACMRYVELNPVRAGMVEAPGDYRWCSYRVNALGEADKLFKPHREYLALGTTQGARQQTFRELFVTEIDDPAWLLIRSATQQGVLVGDGQFAEVIAHRLGQALTARPRGRPRKEKQRVEQTPF